MRLADHYKRLTCSRPFDRRASRRPTAPCHRAAGLVTICVALVWAVLVTTGIVLAPSAASAQTSQGVAGIDSTQALAKLSDAELRDMLLSALQQNQTAGRSESFNPAIAIWRLQTDFGKVRARFFTILGAWRAIPDELSNAFQRLTAKREQGSFGFFMLAFFVAMGIGYAAERWLGRRFTPFKSNTTAANAHTEVLALHHRLGISATALLLRIGLILAFVAVASLSFFIIANATAQDRVTFFFYLAAVAIVRVVSALFAAFISPANADIRISLYTDSEARLLHKGLSVATGLVAFGFFTCALFGTLGVGGDAHPLLLLIVGTAFITGLVITVYASRNAIVNDLIGGNTITTSSIGRLRRSVAQVWPWIMMISFVVIWLATIYTALSGLTPLYGAGIFTIIALLLLPTLDAALEREAARTINAGKDVASAILRASRIAILVIALICVATAWRVDPLAMAETGMSAGIVNAVVQIALTLLVSFVLWQGVRIWIDRRIAEEDAELAASGLNPAEMEIGGEGMSRSRTLLPLLRLTVAITLAVISTMIVLSAIGLNIGPILAGAGVVGLAIGFGSQTLVRDVVSGVFFLVDDAFRLGEYVDVGSVKGTVEKISIRSLRLRHHRGAVHTVPFGEIATLTNYSRDWAIMKLKFRLPFETDIEKVRKILKNVGQELLNHPEVGEDFLQPFKSQGVLEVDDYGLVVRAKFMCKPGRQFLIRRHAYVAVQQAFAENEIEFAQPEVRVLVGSDDDDDDRSQKRRDREAAVAGAAAQNAITQVPVPTT